MQGDVETILMDERKLWKVRLFEHLHFSRSAFWICTRAISSFNYDDLPCGMKYGSRGPVRLVCMEMASRGGRWAYTILIDANVEGYWIVFSEWGDDKNIKIRLRIYLALEYPVQWLTG